MEVVVYLALIVLAAVFCFSLFILVVMCRRRVVAMRQLRVNSKLQLANMANEKVESIAQLSPLIAQVLSNNQWIYDISGMLEHCVLILKMCHALSERLSSISLNFASPTLNSAVLTATLRIMPRFDDLLKAMAIAQVDVRMIEARASALVSACWALAFPFIAICPKQVELLNGLLNEMENHVEALRVLLLNMEHSCQAKAKNGRAKFPPLATVLEETSLIEDHSKINESNSEEEPLFESRASTSDEAPADPSAN